MAASNRSSGARKEVQTRTKSGTHRVQVEFTEKGYEQLQQLLEDSHTKTISQLVRDALGFYEWYIKEKNRDAHILVRHGEEVERVIFR